jgi:HlyD family secretion protein
VGRPERSPRPDAAHRTVGFTKASALGFEEQHVWIIIDITSPREAWLNLSDGYRGEVQVITDEIDKATVVPIGTLFRRGDTWQVFVVERWHARLRYLKIACRSGRLAAISEGLRPGDTVVLYPPASLREGSSIRLP